MQTTSHILMIRPVRFTSNPQTASSNAFQNGSLDPGTEQRTARQEFDAYVHALRNAGINVVVIDDTFSPHTPDSIFPNNWVSFHADGRVFVYPMEAANRRFERRRAVLANIGQQFHIREIVDMSHFEMKEKFLEGTGSMVFDHVHKLAYACHSSRSHPDIIRIFEERTGYRAIRFHALDRHGKAIYHTNVIMCVGNFFAVVCLEAVVDAGERKILAETLRSSGKKIIEISYSQMESFAGNMLELHSKTGNPVVALSRRAWASLTVAQQTEITHYAEPVLAPIETIEHLGGGGARCMIAEIFLPPIIAREEQSLTA